MLKIVIEREPIPAARPRFSGRSCYQPKRNRQYRQEIQASAMAAMSGRKDRGKKRGSQGDATRKIYGDVDNHLKAIFDGMNQIVFVDDSQIVRCVVEKFTDKENPRAEIFISGG